MEEIRQTISKGHRVLVTTLTKRMAEDLSAYLTENGVKTAYLHSEIDTLERGDILKDLRLGTMTYWLELIYCVKVWTFQKLVWWQLWTPTKKVSCVVSRR